MRVIGTETEYGVYRPGDAWANPIALSSTAVRLYAAISRRGTAAEGAGPVRWDYTAEDPLNDLRGMRMSRAAADPSLLTFTRPAFSTSCTRSASWSASSTTACYISPTSSSTTAS